MDIPFFTETSSYFFSIEVTIQVEDTSGARCSSKFILYIINLKPYTNQPGLQEQFNMRISKIVTDSKFTFKLSDSSFQDDDGDELVYRLKQSNRFDTPFWLAFDPGSLVISGRPPESEVFKKFKFVLIAKDPFQQVEQTF